MMFNTPLCNNYTTTSMMRLYNCQITYGPLITHGSTLTEVNMALVLIACVITGTVLGHRVAVSLGVAS